MGVRQLKANWTGRVVSEVLQSSSHAEARIVTFRDKLLALMAARGWSVSDLAQASDLSFPTVRSYTAKGKNARLPNLTNAFRLAEALGVSVEVFRECEDFAKDGPKGTSGIS